VESNQEKHPEKEDLTLPLSTPSVDLAPSQPDHAHDLIPSQPNSARSGYSQDSKRSSLSIGATAESLNRRGSLSERVAQILADRSTPTVSTPKQGGSQKSEVDVDARSEVDSDVERITGEYKAILQGVSDKLAAGETDNIQKMADDALKSSKSDIVIETTTTTEVPVKPEEKQKPVKTITYQYMPQPLTTVDPSSGSDTEDALDKDVRRILAKYGRHLSSDEETDKPKPEFPKPQAHVPSEGRSSPAGSAYSTDDTLSHRVQNLLLKSADMGSTMSPIVPANLPGYMYDDPARSMTLPMDLVSANTSSSEEHTEPTESTVEPHRSEAPEPREVIIEQPSRKMTHTSKDETSSVDTLHEKVSEILTNSGHFIASDSSLSSTRSPSRTSSVDYKLLQQDMMELESNLESITSADRKDEQRQQDIIITPSTSTVASEFSTPKKFAWDHSGDIAANEDGRFMCTQELSKVQSKKSPSKTYYSSLPLNPLLTDGTVPIDVALDIIHGPEHAPFRHHSEYASFHDSKDLSGLEAAQHSPARRQIKFDDVPEGQSSGQRSMHNPPSELDFDQQDLDEKYLTLPDSLDPRNMRERRDPNRSHLSDESYNRNQSQNTTLESHYLSRTLEDLSSSLLDNEPEQKDSRSMDNARQDYSLNTRSADEEVSSIQEASERQQGVQDESYIEEAKRVWESSQRRNREAVDSYSRTDHTSYTERSSYFPAERARESQTYAPEMSREDRVAELPPRGLEERNRLSDVLPKSVTSHTYVSHDRSMSKSDIPKSTPSHVSHDRSLNKTEPSMNKADSSYRDPLKQNESLTASPVRHQPFTILGQMQNLFTAHRDKASAAQFDESVELRSPLRQNYVGQNQNDEKYDSAQVTRHTSSDRYPSVDQPQSTTERLSTERLSTERLSTEQLIEKYTKKLHELEKKDTAEAQRQRDQRLREELEAKLSGLSDSEGSIKEELVSSTRARTVDPLRYVHVFYLTLYN